MEIPVKRIPLTDITVFWCAALVLLIASFSVNAEPKSPKDANDPNEQWWRKWDAVVKNPSDAHELLEAKCRAVLTVLGNKELDQKHKEKIVDKIMSPVFDSPLMAKLALGRENWSKLNEKEHDRFTILFTERLKNFYLDKVTLYTDEKVLFKPAVPKKDAIYIPMILVSNGKDTAILYKLRKVNESWKIYDVEVQGVSVLLTYRSQFDDILRRGSVKDLLSQLEKPPTQ